MRINRQPSLSRTRTYKVSYAVIAGCFSIISALALSQDYEREARHALEVEDSLIDGDIIELSSTAEAEKSFINILYEAEVTSSDASKTAILLLHGSGIHPNWPDLVYPLRTGLVDHQLTTFAMQMPVASLEASHDAYVPLFPLAKSRLAAGLQFLTEQGYDKVYVIAHSLGAAMATYGLAELRNTTATENIQSLIIIGMADMRDSGIDNIAAVKALPYPILDIYGDQDLESVINSAKDRAATGESADKYSQQVIADATHMFVGKEQDLQKVITDWLAAN